MAQPRTDLRSALTAWWQKKWKWAAPAGLVMVIGALAWFKDWPILTLVMVIVGMLCLYNALPDPWQIWITGEAALGASIVVSFTLLAAWFWVNYSLPLKSGAQFAPQTVGDTDPGQYIFVQAPAALPVDAEAVLRVFVAETTPVTDTFLVTITLPAAVRFVDVPYQQTLTETLALAGARGVDLKISNSRLLTAIQPSQVGITITVGRSGLAGQVSGSVSTEVETEATYALRQLVNSTVNEKSPLILVTTALLSVAGALFTQRQKKRLAGRQLKSAEDDFLRALRDRNVDGARESLEKYKQLESESGPADPQQRELAGLLNIAEGKGDVEAQIEALQHKRPDDTSAAVAMLLATPGMRDLGLQAMRALRQELQHRVHELLQPDKQQTEARSKKEKEALAQLEQSDPTWPPWLPPQQPVESEPVNPFEFERAEVDRWRLFQDKAAFWKEHPLALELSRAQVGAPYVIGGAAGSGRTTLALAQSQGNADMCAVYLMGQPSLAEIQSAFAQKLLGLIETLPTRLVLLAAAEIDLLARFLAAALGAGYVVVQLEAARVKWAKQAEAAPAAPAQPSAVDPHWQVARESSLAMIQDQVRAFAGGPPLSPEHWAREAVGCTRFWHYTRARLVIDAASLDKQWFETLMAPNLRGWYQDGLETFVFLPGAPDALPVVRDGITRQDQLAWSPKQLEDLARHRYRAIVSPTEGLDSQFASREAEAAFFKTLAFNPTPRWMAQLWSVTQDQVRQSGTLIDFESIQQGLSRLS